VVLTAYCKQQIVQLYFERRVSYGNVVHVLAAEGLRVPKQTVWATVQKYKKHGTISRLPGSGRPFKLTGAMVTAIEERMQQDNETTSTQLVKMLEENGWKVVPWREQSTVERARKMLGWTFHGSRYCQLIRHANKEKRVEWARANLHESFDNVVWTDESTIQLDNNCT
jgi:transposase